jgi:hypothetical protein
MYLTVRDGAGLARNDHEMNVVGHQAATEQSERVEHEVLAHQVQVNDVFHVGSEKELPLYLQ